MIRSFEPIADAKSKILILGTMPGAQSLIREEYYGNRQNAFWRIMFALFQEEYTDVFADKKAILLKNHVAAWDVLQACEREGSLDSDIVDPHPNNFTEFFQTYPGIEKIYFNGGNAEIFFKRYAAKQPGIPMIPKFRLPSTSPTNTIPFQEKLEKWNLILDGLALSGNVL